MYFVGFFLKNKQTSKQQQPLFLKPFGEFEDVEAKDLKNIRNHGTPGGGEFTSMPARLYLQHAPACLPQMECEKAPAGVNVGISLMVVCTSSDSAVMKWQPVKSVLSPLT